MSPAPDARPLFERRFAVSGALALALLFLGAALGSLAARAAIPGSSAAPVLGAFMLPLGWALGWQGPRHAVLACSVALAPVLLPAILVWLVWRLARGQGLGAAAPAAWRPDPWVFLIVPACALCAALAGVASAWQTGAPLLRSGGLLAAVGLGWGLVLAVLHHRGVLPDEGGADVHAP